MHLLLIAASTVCASLPMVVFVAIVRWMDRYEREPVGMVALAFLWGASGAIVLGMASTTLLLQRSLEGLAPLGASFDTRAFGAFLGQVVIAPLVEEPCKGLILVPIALSRSFDDMTDGFVYGAAAGLGFAMTENFLYFVSAAGDAQAWFGTVVIRTLYSAIMHATATAALGAGMGYGRFRGRRGLVLGGVAGLAVGLGIHVVWNGLLTIDQFDPGNAAWHANLVLLPVLVGAAIAVFEACVQHERRVILDELGEEVSTGALPSGHPEVLASWWRRLGHAWLPARVDRHAYVVAATSLALRKRQVRLMGADAPDWYRSDVARLRSVATGLLREPRAPGRAPAAPPR